MIASLDFLRELSVASVLFRILQAMLFGGLIGLERGRKWGAAGLRTCMLVCMGAALTMLLSQYEAYLFTHDWAQAAQGAGVMTDISRFGAQVINGIGFLGAGTILVTGRQEVKGLTTAAGVWASACVGLAIGAGFYECVCLAFVLIFAVLRLFPHVETLIVENARNMNLYVAFQSMDNVGEIIAKIKQQQAQIYEIELSRGSVEKDRSPDAVFTIRLHEKQGHTRLLAELSALACVRVVEEL